MNGQVMIDSMININRCLRQTRPETACVPVLAVHSSPNRHSSVKSRPLAGGTMATGWAYEMRVIFRKHHNGTALELET